MRFIPFCVIFLLSTLAPLSTEALGAEDGKIYRSRDATGNVIYSDKAEESADEIEVDSPTTYSPQLPGQKRAQRRRAQMPEKESVDTATAYKSIRITSPPHNEALRSNNGDLKVTFVVEPPLKSTHSVQLMIDGVLTETVKHVPIFMLQNIDRGTHKLVVNIIDDASGKVLLSSTGVTTTILRHSILHRR